MRVIFCAYDRPNHIATGPNVWLQRLIPYLIENGVDVLTLFLQNGEAKDCPTLCFFKRHNLKYASLQIEELPYIESQIKWILLHSKIFVPDILVANLVAPAFYTKKYLKNIPVVATLHSNDPFYESVIRNFVSASSKLKIDTAIAVSKYIETLAHQSNSGFSVERIPCGTPLTNQRASYHGGVMRVAYVGRIVEEQKQILKLTQSFCWVASKIEDIEFGIYGDGPDSENVNKIIALNKAESKVHYFGPVNPAKVHEVISTYHAFTLMSDFEGMPIALLEVMACGLVPVCLAEKSGVNEILKDSENGLIVTDREESYYNAILCLKNNPELWNRLSENAIKTIEQEYSTDINNHRWLHLLDKLYNPNINSKFRLPWRISVNEFEPLFSGDRRMPPFKKRIAFKFKELYLKLRLFLRPRARLCVLFNILINNK